MSKRAEWIAYQPDAELLAESVRVTKRMQRLSMPTATKTPVKKMESPGRLISRNVMQAAALRARGNTAAAMKVPMFRGTHVERANRPPGVVGIMSDVSGSMKWSTTAVGEAAWLLARGAAHSGARVASVVFGTGVDPVVFPGEVPQTVLVRSANDYGHNPDRALAALDGALGLSQATAAGVPTSRVVVILSDLQWGDERKPFIARVRALMTLGVRFVVLGPQAGWPQSPDYHIPMHDRIPADITARLGLHVPVDPRALIADSPQRTALPARYQDALTRWGVHAFQRVEVPPLEAGEIHAARAAGVQRLTPLTIIPRVMLAETNEWGGTSMDAKTVRGQIVDHTLRVLEGME
jgi:hypothetical protein